MCRFFLPLFHPPLPACIAPLPTNTPAPELKQRSGTQWRRAERGCPRDLGNVVHGTCERASAKAKKGARAAWRRVCCRSWRRER